MAKDLNKVQLTGRLGADPEMRFTPQGSAVTTFRVASNRSWKTADGEQKEDTEWFSIVTWNKLAEICNQYLTKGTRVYVEGRAQTRSWEDTQTGQTRYKTEIIANDMIILDGNRREGMPSYPDVEDASEPWEAEPEAAPAPRRQPAAVTTPAAPAPAARANGNNRTPARPAAAPARSAPARKQPVVDEDDLPF